MSKTTADLPEEGRAEKSEGIDPKLLDLLVCPLTKTRLTFDRERCELVSDAAKLAYPVRGGVPIMLPSEARSLDKA
ncbi:Trm112 family protein [Oricola indica]|jgi:uncharacterized protein YbaR (Trm112 family)|uniref:Trm112 family protein n=1 Tax=Oricola indica TaxID=2872591 RepID=UPI001CBC1213|nr:Trm112 family protein [Oricola indica]